MKKAFKTTITTLVAIFVVAGTVQAVGTLTPSGTAGDDTQYTLNDIYAKITADTDATLGSGTMTVPDASTATSTFRTLTEIYNALPDWQTLSNATTTVSEGFYEATTLTAVDSDLTSGNIASGVNIFGVSGSFFAPQGNPKTGATIEASHLNDRACSDGGTGKCDDGYYEKGMPFSGTRFTDNGDDTISDAATDLMWTKYKSSNSRWNAAITYCEDLTLASHTDWKLPNFFEVYSIVNFGSNPTSYSEFDGLTGRIWTSGRHPFFAGSAYVIDFSSDGVPEGDFMNDSIQAALCVRDDV